MIALWRNARRPYVAANKAARCSRIAATTALVAAVIFVPETARAQKEPPSLSAARVTAQVVAGTLAAPVAFFGGGYASKRIAKKFGASDHAASRAGYIGAYTSAWLATTAVPAVIGRDGNFAVALAGSALGMGAAIGAERLGNHFFDSGKRSCSVLCWTLGAAIFALPSIGASIAFDQSRR